MYALVTGASAGIGMEIAKYLSILGYDLILTARSEDKLQDLRKTILKRCSLSLCLLAAIIYSLFSLTETSATRTLTWEQVSPVMLSIAVLTRSWTSLLTSTIA